MPKITVITPSIRPDLLGITQECLERQTFQDFEWLTEVGLRNRGYTLPSDWNRLISRAKGDIIVSFQDCIKIPDNTLEIIAGLDHTKTAYTYPVGQTLDFEKEPTWDWRALRPQGEIEPRMWEADFASAPKSMFYDIGGFDEEFNKGWSWENVEVAIRAYAAGYKFELHNSFRTVSLRHDELRENPFRNKRENNDKRARVTEILAQGGDYKKDYLTEPLLMNDGEIADRYSILLLKSERLKDENIDGEMEVFQREVDKKPYLKPFIDKLYIANGKTWDLESDIRRGKENELGLEEVGRRAIAIRECNKERIAIKNECNEGRWFAEVKVNHASS